MNDHHSIQLERIRIYTGMLEMFEGTGLRWSCLVLRSIEVAVSLHILSNDRANSLHVHQLEILSFLFVSS